MSSPTPATGSADGAGRPPSPPDLHGEDPAAESLHPDRELPRFAGLGLYALLIGGTVLFPLIALLAALFSLFYFAAMFGVLFFLSLGGVALLEFVRLRGWRYSVREMIGAWLALFMIGSLCAALGYRQYQLNWAAEKPLALENWAELSTAQRRGLAENLVDGRLRPTLAELLDFRQRADYKPRQVVYKNRFVQEFAYALGPGKLLGRECLVVRIDRDRQDPLYSIEMVDTGDWSSPD